ncbi:uncharacterized protein LOC118372627 [Oncorhynchus keta]|uniref:uncharacterized protein LOC118372627 n=1 Tax=Oncorhynchus keta TaxID=8018 RepID=UPI00227CA201|nr:uncharacterized protein LOC118372627 [Oncorhynchus keta]
MLILLQLINVLLLTSIGSTDAEKLFHSRDHSDLQIPSSHQAELITDQDTAELFLSRYGFIRPVNWEELQFDQSTGISNDEDFPEEEDLSGIQEGDSSMSRAETDDDDDDDEDSPNPTESQAFISALRDFQMVSGLSVTGLFDDATKAAMNKPRCGVPDKETDDATEEVHDSTSSALGINTVTWLTKNTDTSEYTNKTFSGVLNGSATDYPADNNIFTDLSNGTDGKYTEVDNSFSDIFNSTVSTYKGDISARSTTEYYDPVGDTLNDSAINNTENSSKTHSHTVNDPTTANDRPHQSPPPPTATDRPHQSPPPTTATDRPHQSPRPTTATDRPHQHQSPPPTTATDRPHHRQSPPPTTATDRPHQSPRPTTATDRPHQHQSPPPTTATDRPHQSPPPTTATDRPHQSPPPTTATDRPHQSPPPPTATDRPHQSPRPTTATDRPHQHQSPPPTTATDRPHQSPPPTTATDRPHQSPLPPTATDRPHQSPPPPTATDRPHQSPPPTTATDRPHQSPPPTTATDRPHQSPPPTTATDRPHQSPPPTTATDRPHQSPLPPTATDRPHQSPPPPTATDRPHQSPPPTTATDRPHQSPPPSTATDRPHQRQSPPPTTGTDRPHQSPPPTTATDRPHQSPPPTTATDRPHWSRTPTTATDRPHQRPPPTTATERPHQRPPPSTATDRPHQSPPPTTGTDRPHLSPPPTTATDRPHQSPPPTTGTDRPHQSPPPTTGTDRPHQSHHPTTGTDRPHQSPPPTTATDRHQNRVASLLSKRRQKRHVGRRAWGNMAFSKMVLKWRLIGEGYSSQLTIQDQRHIISLAFRMWSEISPLEFIEDTSSPWRMRHLGCNQKFDGTGREFAHAWFLGDIHFDDDEHFTAPNTGSGISLLKGAVRFNSLVCFPLGGCKGQFNTVFDWIRKERTQYGEVVIRFNTYFMRDGWYWLYENRTNRTRYGDPVALQVGWHGIPTDGVDACVHVWNRNTDAVYFFKGTQYWRYDDDNDQVFTVDPEGHLSRLISEGFPGVPSPIDTAFYDRRDYSTSSRVYVFDVTANRVSPGFPRKITAVFPAVVSGDHPDGYAVLEGGGGAETAGGNRRCHATARCHASGLLPRNGPLPRNGLLPHRKVEEQWFDICNVHPSTLKWPVDERGAMRILCNVHPSALKVARR